MPYNGSNRRSWGMRDERWGARMREKSRQASTEATAANGCPADAQTQAQSCPECDVAELARQSWGRERRRRGTQRRSFAAASVGCVQTVSVAAVSESSRLEKLP